MKKIQFPSALTNHVQKLKNIRIPGKDKIKGLGLRVKDSGAGRFLVSTKFIKIVICPAPVRLVRELLAASHVAVTALRA